MRTILATLVLLIFGGAVTRAADKFEPTPESLKQYKCPEWFRDAKFGIFICWNAYTVPAIGDWYARHMYDPKTKYYKYHVANYGHPSKVGYKDIIKQWKGENFDADALVTLFKRAGAKYIVPMANHHDNFDLWDSKHHKWNSVNYGPKKDIIGLWEKAIRKQGLRFGVTEHNARAYSWCQTNKGSDNDGPLKGVPYDGNDPKYVDLYLPKSDDTNMKTPLNPPESWRKQWLARTKDLIDRYKPDHMYFDGAIPFAGDDNGKTGMELIAHYYNQNMKWHNGRLEGVMCTKWINEHGILAKGATTIDHEGTCAKRIIAEPWQTDATIGAWFWVRNQRYRSVGRIIYQLVDIVSKNGNLLLNIPPKADGTLDPQAKQLLVDIGKWMDLNGQAIYGTRPWKMFKDGAVRFTSKGTDLYAIAIKWPGAGKKLILPSLKAAKDNAKVSNVVLLGHDGKLTWKQDDKGLTITMPEKQPCQHAWSFKLSLTADTTSKPPADDS